jgi:uracil-DNA glycosylase family protein
VSLLKILLAMSAMNSKTYRVVMRDGASLQEFREHVRALIAAKVLPRDVTWLASSNDLFGETPPPDVKISKFTVPGAYVELARDVLLHRDPQRFALLYELLWRLLTEDRMLLSIFSDPLVYRLRQMQKAVGRDRQRMVFARIRKAKEERAEHVIDAPTAPRRLSVGETRPVVSDAEADTLAALKHQAQACQRCPLFCDATQTVFGEGPSGAPVVFVGEQPGDQEDLAGRPFVGPAGQLFDRALGEAGIDRERVYVTNAVKHFKFTPRGKKRIHQKPNAGEIEHCRWWLDREVALIHPKLVVALGGTAARALTGKDVKITQMRGRTVSLRDGVSVLFTVHPSYLLRLPDAAAQAVEYRRFVEDLALVLGTLPAIAKAA